MIRLLFILLIISFLYTSCEEEPKYPETIIGTWRWTKSFGGIAGVTYTPASTGDQREIIFTSDSVYRYYYNDTLKAECKYGIIQTADEKIINYECSQPKRQYYSFESNNILMLDDGCCDQFVHWYERKN